MKKNILAFGEVLWDLLPSGAALGGAPFNFAYRVNSLQHNGFMVSRLGRDDLGRKAAERIERLGMDDRFIQWDDSLPTGTVQIQLDERNQPDYYIVPEVAYDRIETAADLLEFASTADCICFGTLVQRAPVTRHTLDRLLDKAGNVMKLLDINLRKNCFSEETITNSLDKADILKLNEDEAAYLRDLFSLPGDSLADFCKSTIGRWSLSHCLVTLGEQGVFAMAADGDGIYEPGFKIPLIDPCGSGDAFTAGFINGLFEEKPLTECCRFGNAYGAIVASQAGATTPITLSEIQDFLHTDRERIIKPELESYYGK